VILFISGGIFLAIGSIIVFGIGKRRESGLFAIYRVVNLIASILIFPAYSMLSGVDRFESSENFPGISMKVFLVPLLGVISFHLMEREANNRSKDIGK
jgi:hypothetical protein